MAILGLNTTHYSSEVLEGILTLASTSNQLVEKRLIMVIPGIHKATAVPRLKRAGKILQKRKKNPNSEDSKGDLSYSERMLTPHDMMAYMEFDPSVFEYLWRQFQPTGNLLFEELPPQVQSALLGEVLKQVNSELGDLYINGEYQEGSDDQFLMDGILTQAAKVEEVIRVASLSTTMRDRLFDLAEAIPETIRENPNLKILMSRKDFSTYDKELTNRESKNSNETEENKKLFKGIPIETLANWPSGLIVATLCSDGVDSNLFAAVNLQDDENVIQVDKVSAASELYFVKMLMKADTNIAFGEEFIALDWREDGAFAGAFDHFIEAEPETIDFPVGGGTVQVAITASGAYELGEVPTGFTATITGTGVSVTAANNTTGESAKTGTLTVSLSGNEEVSVDIELNQPTAG
ncbi:hypothetical protein [Viscerimonas tarda]